MDGFDLTKYQEDEKEKAKIKKIMGRVLSGREGYEAIVEEKKIIKRCPNAVCNWALEGGEKFCPECGEKC
ncbi:MAG: hypothetical protein IH845_04390 [Nanoarchaeota archaeon]|nr:hypothetical protein [Nanoarchaeota archaeon]